MANNTTTVPSGFGGLMRYNEEYDSKFKFGPGAVVAMIIAVVVVLMGLRFLYG
jgi:preprotein translocase subunit Sec61beta